MKNRRIPGFPSPEDQDSLQFYFMKSLSYTARILLYLICIAVGLFIQIISLSFWPGAFLLIFAAMINLVKGHNIKPIPAGNDEGQWTRTGMDKVHQINRLREDINQWDKDAMDISNGVGCLFFGVVAIVIISVFFILIGSIGSNAALIFIADSIILVLSLWFNGMRIKGYQGILYMKTDMIIEMKNHFDRNRYAGESFVPSLLLAEDKEGKNFPTDCRFNIIFDNGPDDFYGILAQICINTVQGSNYPYFYCVITAKKGFGLNKYVRCVQTPKSIVAEYSEDSEAEVIIIRQKTTKSTGYHTKINSCKNIFDIALAMARMILDSRHV
ncbi:MAG TPA: hypothetical protein GXX26_03825 [Clostridiaceae bacterium]|nr:hypothetical protein [Clostridiaceae bacterium]